MPDRIAKISIHKMKDISVINFVSTYKILRVKFDPTSRILSTKYFVKLVDL